MVPIEYRQAYETLTAFDANVLGNVPRT